MHLALMALIGVSFFSAILSSLRHKQMIIRPDVFERQIVPPALLFVQRFEDFGLYALGAGAWSLMPFIADIVTCAV